MKSTGGGCRGPRRRQPAERRRRGRRRCRRHRGSSSSGHSTGVGAAPSAYLTGPVASTGRKGYPRPPAMDVPLSNCTTRPHRDRLLGGQGPRVRLPSDSFSPFHCFHVRVGLREAGFTFLCPRIQFVKGKHTLHPANLIHIHWFYLKVEHTLATTIWPYPPVGQSSLGERTGLDW
ncbi:hypothetical protein EJB05_01584 [Eragrostis curvula]|uniref:Uncharacterized protein n=1 Tax=Eragrostis curvula TaxID=38414 RepID=A0A5J9WS77_9POAL|nr:hypothetical protein EJB05_01584 [Eragrostis curvula]